MNIISVGVTDMALGDLKVGFDIGIEDGVVEYFSKAGEIPHAGTVILEMRNYF